MKIERGKKVVIFHSWAYIFDTFSKDAKLIIFVIFAVTMILSRKTQNLWCREGYLPLKVMTFLHAGYHVVAGLVFPDFFIPRWLLWIEIIFFVASLIVCLTSKGILKGLLAFLLSTVTFFTINLIVEIGLTHLLVALIIGLVLAIADMLGRMEIKKVQ